ncbi:xanthine dehydrogenase family protein subunit M [Evansella sp. LMS18]|uniref:FAD binding domain-containing protein n=1 Tax=Evansella sp. LMS18 TaxID=2924033 RepID=UPI0020D12001|nr:xanthine dehydrogenase family protein subunit M [Evansella sp. LMS18]UTR09943.1 xanthine dehydrogenase family protein subunit M [Evansella sp. LMS18]
MIPSEFAYKRANSVEEALQLLKESDGEGKLLAGGHSLLPLMKFRLTNPQSLIDISRIEELKGVKLEGDRLVVGAMTTYDELVKDETAQQQIPVLVKAVRIIGDQQVRNRGTIGGNLAHGDPAADLPGAALALDAELEVHGDLGKETIAAEDFFIAPLVTMLGENSIVTSVSFAVPAPHSRSVYLKYEHPASGYAVIGVCAVAAMDDSGKVEHIRIGINGVSDVPYRARAVEESLAGTEPTEALVKEASEKAADDGEIGSDLFASEKYRRHLAKVYTERALKGIFFG